MWNWTITVHGAVVHLLCFYCIIKFLSKLHLVFVVDFCFQFLLMIHTIFSLKELDAIVTFLSHFVF